MKNANAFVFVCSLTSFAKLLYFCQTIMHKCQTTISRGGQWCSEIPVACLCGVVRHETTNLLQLAICNPSLWLYQSLFFFLFPTNFWNMLVQGNVKLTKTWSAALALSTLRQFFSLCPCVAADAWLYTVLQRVERLKKKKKKSFWKGVPAAHLLLLCLIIQAHRSTALFPWELTTPDHQSRQHACKSPSGRSAWTGSVFSASESSVDMMLPIGTNSNWSFSFAKLSFGREKDIFSVSCSGEQTGHLNSGLSGLNLEVCVAYVRRKAWCWDGMMPKS